MGRISRASSAPTLRLILGVVVYLVALLCSSARLEHVVPFSTRQGGPTNREPLPLLGIGRRRDTGLTRSWDGGCPKAPP